VSFRPVVSAVCAVLLGLSLMGGCIDGDDPPPPPPPIAPPPPVAVPPPIAPPPPIAAPPPVAPPPPPTTTARYPLSQQEAYNLVSAGVAVAGAYREGGELVITPTQEVEEEEVPVQKQVCDYVTKCHYGTVYETQRKTKTVYRLTGVLHVTESNVPGAFAKAGMIGITHFRQAG
jgi:hypothetical protein